MSYKNTFQIKPLYSISTCITDAKETSVLVCIAIWVKFSLIKYKTEISNYKIISVPACALKYGHRPGQIGL